jgi:hypothetical protein
VLELAMAASLGNQHPAILLQQPKDLGNLHRPSIHVRLMQPFTSNRLHGASDTQLRGLQRRLAAPPASGGKHARKSELRLAEDVHAAPQPDPVELRRAALWG